VECSSLITAISRRTRLYCVGAAKSGTKSIADCFRQSLRSAHEPESEQTIDTILSVAQGTMTREALREYVCQRDQRLSLEVDSSQLNYFILGELVALFPDARFVLTIRDPYSWLDSFINHQLNRPSTPRWTRLRELRFRARDLKHPSEEDALRRRGLYTLDGYLSYWNTHNQNVCSSVAAEQRLVVRTHEISQRAGEIARFAGLDPSVADSTSSHSNKAETKHCLLGELNAEYLASKVHEHCGTLMQAVFPDLLARDARAVALTR
jgi:hypothetical protein